MCDGARSVGAPMLPYNDALISLRNLNSNVLLVPFSVCDTKDNSAIIGNNFVTVKF